MKNQRIVATLTTGIVLSILNFILFVVIVTGTTIYLLDSVQGSWVPVLISLSVVFVVSFVINIILYTTIILNKNSLVKNQENEFSFWIAAFIFWILQPLSYFIFIFIYLKERKI